MSIGRRIKMAAAGKNLLVTNTIRQFYEDVPEGVVWDDDAYELWKTLTSDAADNEDRSGRFGSSTRGKCMRAQVFAFIGMPKQRLITPEQLNLFSDGKWRHLRWQMLLLQSGAITEAEWKIADPMYRVKTSLDGINRDYPFGVEIKGDRNNSRVLDGVPDEHMLQMHTMMLVSGLDTFAYVSENKASNEWREVVVRRDEKIMDFVKQELEELNAHVDDERLPDPLPACQRKEGPYRSCAFAVGCISKWRGDNSYPQSPSWDD